MIKILFASDFHLGVDEKRFPIPVSKRIATLKRVTDLAYAHDIFLIAGDLFDRIDGNDPIVDTVAEEFLKIKKRGCKILFTPGESDIDQNGELPSFYNNINIDHIFFNHPEPEPYSLIKENQKIFIYGLPCIAGADLSRIRRVDEDGFHAGLFHADFQLSHGRGEEGIHCIDREDVMSLNLDFYALGHQHNFKLFKSLGRIIGAYTGSPEALSFNETGERYIVSMTIRENEIYQIKRLAVNSVKVGKSVIDCTGLGDSTGIIEELNKNRGRGCIFRIELTGDRAFMFERDLEGEYGKDFLKLYIDDFSTLTIDNLVREYSDEDTLRGEFFSKLAQRMEKGMPGDVDLHVLEGILNKAVKTEIYSPGEFICRYTNA